MREWVKRIIACFLITAMMVCGPFANVPKNAFAAGDDTASEAVAEEATEAEADETENAADEGKDTEDVAEPEKPEESDDSKLYIKELKLAEGITAEDAQKSLTDEGYFILEKDGKPLNLNEGSASHSALSGSPEEVYVYLGFKTTTDPDEAITDMAVMNMKGGYSFEDYSKLIEQHMETKIKPFMDKFVDTIKEYRENYNKPENSVNHIKADMVRQLLNRYTDDDTDGSPIGDLLLNETKYEMGDEAYNALSDSEKKEHADIITMLLQGNLTNISMIEKLLVKAADASDDTWVDRFENASLDKLREDIEEANPNATMNDIDKILDKKYNDAAKEILNIWDDYAEICRNCEDRKDELTSESEELVEKMEEIEKVDSFENMDEDQQKETAREIIEIQEELLEQAQDSLAVGVAEQAEKRETDDMNMREFFSQPAENFRGKKIRNLYPMISSLSAGQIAGLQFLTVADLLDAGFNNVTNLKKSLDNIEDVPVVSVYEGVNRELFESGAVALTNDTLRQNAVQNMNEGVDIRCMIAAGCMFLAVASAVAVPFIVSRAAMWEHNVQSLLASEIDDGALLMESAETGDAGFYANKVKKLKIISGVLTGAMVILIGVTVFLTISAYYDEYHIDFTPIPKYIVDETDITTINDKGEKEFMRNDTAYYRVVECNRKTMSKGKYSEYYDKRIGELGDYGDLNGTAGKEWLALYTVKYENAAPILADSLMVMTGADSSTPPDDYKLAIHMFGEKNAYNLQNNKLLYREPEAVRIYFKQDYEVRKSAEDSGSTGGGKEAKLDETGSLASDRSVIMYLVIGFAAGALVVWLVMVIFGRKRSDGTVE